MRETLKIRRQAPKNDGMGLKYTKVSTTDGKTPSSAIDPELLSQFFENKNDKWLTTQEAANYLRVSPKRLLNLVSNGKIPHYKFGRSNRYLESELRELLLAHSRGGFYGN